MTRQRNIFGKLEKSKEREIENLKKQSKPLNELVEEARFYVENVTAQTCGTDHTPDSEIVVGGISPVYHTGFTSRLFLVVKHADLPDFPVRILTFDGFSAVRGGDKIRARFPKLEERSSGFSYDESQEIFYIPREKYSSEEQAIEIGILDGEKVVRSDLGVNFRKYGLKPFTEK